MNEARKLIWEVLNDLEPNIKWERFKKGDKYYSKYEPRFIKNFLKAWWITVQEYKNDNTYMLEWKSKFEDYQVTIIIEPIQLNKYKSRITVIEGYLIKIIEKTKNKPLSL